MQDIRSPNPLRSLEIVIRINPEHYTIAQLQKENASLHSLSYYHSMVMFLMIISSICSFKYNVPVILYPWNSYFWLGEKVFP